ncbi:MAG: 50S ribosomal protein L10 [Anaerolineae bacterium]|nr:50S ribosomal protein L10 [Anaerolineae bacterium]
MAITRKRKEELIQQYVDLLADARGVVITEYRGMTVQHLDALRGKLREQNSSFTITKNTLLKIALNEVGMAVPEDMLKGPVALVVANNDLPSTVKTVLEYADDNDLLIAKGGISGESTFAESDLKALSELPPLDVIRAQLIGMTTMPIAQFLGLLEEPGRQLVGVIKAGSECLVNVLAAYAAKEEGAA